jgi:agmatinase
MIAMGYIDLFTNKPLSVSFTHNNTINNNHEKADVYIVGVPFDSTTSYRPGARFGPNAIREALLNIEFNSLLDHSKSLESVKINDVGNIKSTTKPEAMVDMLNKIVNELVSSNNRLIGILGGEHLLTLASYNAIADHYSSSNNNNKDVMLVVFDAHLDLRDEFNDCKLNHATYLHRIIESRGNDGSSVVHIGARGFAKDEFYYASNTRVNLLMAKDILLNYNTAISRLKDIISSYDDVYVSIDLDAIDPAFAKGVGTPEPFGLTPIQMLELLSLLKDKRIRCFDIVELCPPCDDGSTAILAAKLMLELILLNH